MTNPSAKIRVAMLATILVKHVGSRIKSVPGTELAARGCPVAEGVVSSVSFQPFEGIAGSLAVVSGAGKPEFFTIGLNLAICPYRLTAAGIVFSDTGGGEIILTRRT